jgi:capsular polysaccharide transport system ATP-binding protein
MIKIDNITKIYRTGALRKVVFDGVSATMDSRRRYGLLGPNGAGKTTLLKLIAGTELPNRGRVVRSTRVSWPLGFSGGFHRWMTGRENVAFVARVYGADIRQVIDFVEDFAELGPFLDAPVRTYSSGMSARLAFGLSMAIDFDLYLVDEIIAVGDGRFRTRCAQAFAERRQRSGMILASHSPSTIKEYCDHCVVIHESELYVFEDVNEAIEFHKNNL